MEVHHHPDLHHRKKHWKEYFLEFLMIFLAVTMGFFAENIRENFIENKREGHIIELFKKDLTNDTAQLNHLITEYVPLQNAWMDSSFNYLSSQEIKGNERKIAVSLFNATVWNIYSPPDMAITELKTSDNFNLIKNEKVKIAILEYGGGINRFKDHSGIMTNARHAVDTGVAAFFRMKDINQMLNTAYVKLEKGSNERLDENDIPVNLTFKTYDRNSFISLSNRFGQINYLENDMLGQYRRLYKADVKLLKILEEEYPKIKTE
ncbi:MAG TPA: hypothetical protein VIK14_14395 [Ignavibacteria bacterium]